MSEFDSMIGKVKRLEARYKELKVAVPKLEKTKELVEAEVTTLRKHAANVKEKYERMNDSIANGREHHNAWIKQTQDELAEREADIEADALRRSKMLDDRQELINKREDELSRRENALSPKEAELQEREDAVAQREQKVATQLLAQEATAKGLESSRIELNRREAKLSEDRVALDQRTADMAPEFEEIDGLHEAAKADRRQAQKLLDEAKAHIASLDERELKLDARQLEQDAREKRLDAKEVKIDDRQKKLVDNLKRVSSI